MRKSYGDYCFVKQLRKTPTGIVNLVNIPRKDYYILQTMMFRDKTKNYIDSKKELLRKLNHPNVEHIVEIFHEQEELNDILAVITEYCEDGTLEQKIGQLNQIETRHAILDLCAAYRYLHQELHLIHGYLTLQTVLIRNTKLVITQFSQAEYLHNQRKISALKGKKLYMSPQMLKSQKYGLQNDIWALGVIFIELLFQKPISSIMNIIPGNHPDFPEIIINKLSNPKIKNILKDMLQKDSNRIKIKEVQQRFIEAFNADPLHLKMHNQYIQVRNFSSHSCLVRNSENGEVLTLKKYTLPKQFRKGLEIRIQKLKGIKHRNVISILDVKISHQCEVEVITQYCDKKSLMQNIQNLEIVQMIEAFKDIWEGFLYLYSNSVLVLENLYLDKILINEGKIKIPIITQYTFMPKKETFTETDCIWKLGLAFLQIITRKPLKHGDRSLIKNKDFVMQAADKGLQQVTKQILWNYKDMTIQKLESILKKQVYSRNPETQDLFIGDYKLIREISRGAFGNVYIAEPKYSKGQFVALKKIRTPRDTIEQQELNQALIATQLKHPNIVQTMEYFIYKKAELIIIMEMCEEYTLKQVLGNIPNIKQKLKIMNHISQGLSYLHNVMGVIHRDIKPSNILYKDGVLKIADMGKSKFVKPGESMRSLVGSTFYMSPQMVNCKQYNISADVWNLGIVFLQVWLNQKLPNNGILSIRQDFPEQYINKISEVIVKQLLVGMMARDPAKRMKIDQVVERVKELMQNTEKRLL